jgi:hypothetical protein
VLGTHHFGGQSVDWPAITSCMKLSRPATMLQAVAVRWNTITS